MIEQFLIKLNMQLQHNPAVALLGTYPREMKVYFYKNLYMHVHRIFICSSQKLESAQMVFNVKCSTYIPWNTPQQLKATNY